MSCPGNVALESFQLHYDDRRCFSFSLSILFTQSPIPGEGKLEELLEEMPTGQEDLTRERKDRLKEVPSS